MTVASYRRQDGTHFLVSTDGRVYELRLSSMTPDELRGLAAIGYLTAEDGAPPDAPPSRTRRRARRTSSGRTLALVRR